MGCSICIGVGTCIGVGVVTWGAVLVAAHAHVLDALQRAHLAIGLLVRVRGRVRG